MSKVTSQDTVFIAGRRGMVGAACWRALEAAGYENLLGPTSQELDLRRQDEVERWFAAQKPDAVILAAAKVGGILANKTYPAEFIHTNLAIQTNIIHAAWLNEVKRLIFLGSSCIYPKFCPQPIREEHLLQSELEPTNEAYAVAKIAGVKMCQFYNEQYGTDFWALMPTNLFGEGDNFDLEKSHVLSAMIRKFHLAKLAQTGDEAAIRRNVEVFGPIPADVRNCAGLTEDLHVCDPGAASVQLWGTGSPMRELMHVDDMAGACRHVLELPDAIPPQLVNVGTGEDLTIAQLAELVRGVVGFTGAICWDSTKPDGTPRKVLDVSRLHELGFTHAIDLEAGVRRCYEWYLDQLQ